MAVKDVEEYFQAHSKWEKELRELHEIMISTELQPGIKWGAPVYMIDGKNVAGIGAFKNHYGIWFFNGALLKENTALLVNAQEGKTKALRQIRFEKGDKIQSARLIPYVKEAIQNQKEGKEIKVSRNKTTHIPPELQEVLKKDKALAECFKNLTSGRQREYADYISEAKREVTKQNRLEKITPMIKKGIGLNDKYKNC